MTPELALKDRKESWEDRLSRQRGPLRTGVRGWGSGCVWLWPQCEGWNPGLGAWAVLWPVEGQGSGQQELRSEGGVEAVCGGEGKAQAAGTRGELVARLLSQSGQETAGVE